jgi:hypothetical protein
MQNQLLKYTLYLVLLLMIASCRKTDITAPGTASLTVINAAVGTNSLVVNFGGTDPLSNYYVNARQLYYNVFQQECQFNAYSGVQKLGLYNYPDTLPKSPPFVNLTLDLPVGSVNSLFVTGTADMPDTLFTRDHPPYHSPSDSTMGIRFVNLSAGSLPVSINLEGQAGVHEISRLAYKEISAFKMYPARPGVASYTFEFRDMATGALLATYTADGIDQDNTDPNEPVNRWRYRNFTLALLGTPGGTESSAQTILLINNY